MVKHTSFFSDTEALFILVFMFVLVLAPKYLTPEQRCSLGESVFPHPDGCALFYNCSLRFQHRPRRHFASPLEDECPYPQLFSNETLKCENFLNVTCGTRKEPKAPCKYF